MRRLPSLAEQASIKPKFLATIALCAVGPAFPALSVGLLSKASSYTWPIRMCVLELIDSLWCLRDKVRVLGFGGVLRHET